ncbi:MAG: hypothetical protein AAFV80_18665 [Bacteroidota bacterium]
MKKYTHDQILQLVRAFETHQLPKAAWTHEAHLIVAIHHASSYPESQTLGLTRQQIRSYNEAIGTANTDHTGYHETITRIWLTIAHQFVALHASLDLEERVNRFLQSKYADRALIFRFYSKEYLMSAEARLNYVKPDVKSVSIQ